MPEPYQNPWRRPLSVRSYPSGFGTVPATVKTVMAKKNRSDSKGPVPDTAAGTEGL